MQYRSASVIQGIWVAACGVVVAGLAAPANAVLIQCNGNGPGVELRVLGVPGTPGLDRSFTAAQRITIGLGRRTESVDFIWTAGTQAYPVAAVRGYTDAMERVWIELTCAVPCNGEIVMKQGSEVEFRLRPLSGRDVTGGQVLINCAADVLPPPSDASADSPRLISIDAVNADVTQIVQLLAAQCGQKVRVSSQVHGRISVAIHDAPFDYLLRQIARAAHAQVQSRNGEYIVLPNGDLPTS